MIGKVPVIELPVSNLNGETSRRRMDRRNV